MQITHNEFIFNLDKYLKLAETKEIQIINKDQTIDTLSNSDIERFKSLQSVLGVLKTDKPISLDEARYERLTKKLGYKI